MEVAVGVDVGGSGVRALLVARDGTPKGTLCSIPLHSRSREDVLEAVTVAVARVCAGADIRMRAVGIGIPAFMRLPDGVVVLAPNMPDLNGWEASRALSEALAVPVIIENDANSAAFGEAWSGRHRGLDPLVFLGLGTGVGGGVVVQGQLLHGAMGMAGELGHLTVFPDGAPCGCGSHGCLEAYASATGLLRAFHLDTRNLPEADFTRLYGDRGTLTAKDLADLAAQGDAQAFRVFAMAGKALGIAIGQLIHVFNPAAVIVGGRVAGAWPLFWPTLWEEVARRTPSAMRSALVLEKAALGPKAGVIGAAGLAWEAVDPS